MGHICQSYDTLLTGTRQQFIEVSTKKVTSTFTRLVTYSRWGESLYWCT